MEQYNFRPRNTKDTLRPSARKDQKSEEAGEGSSLQVQGNNGPADTLVSDFSLLELWENTFLLYCNTQVSGILFFLEQPYNTNSWETWTKVLTVLRIRLLRVLVKKVSTAYCSPQKYLSHSGAPKKTEKQEELFFWQDFMSCRNQQN